MPSRQRNDGLRKLCACPRRTWAKCSHPWHFSFKWNGEHYRFSLERVVRRIVKDAEGKWRRDRASLGDRITDKTAAETERDRLKVAIRSGQFLPTSQDKPQRDTLTLSQLMETYRRNYIAVQRPGTVKNTAYQIGVILRTELERADGTTRAFGDWLVADIGTGTIDDFQRVRLARGVTAANRDLALLRAMFRWAIAKDHVDRTPFKKSGETVVKLSQEHKRRRRLRPGEGEALLTACGSQLRALVEAALETGCRRGELLSLQWHQVRLEGKAEIFLPAQKTKTKADRTVPVSTRLRSILEMRRNGPDDQELPGDAYVFGNECGEPVKGFKRAWERAILRAHGIKPRYSVKVTGEGTEAREIRTAVLAPETRAALRTIDLHFHDLRREAGSRWLEGGVPLHRIQKWLGHANISQTSTYLMADSADDDDAMRRFDAARGLQQIATESVKGVHEGAVAGTMRDEQEQNSSTKPH